MFWSCFEYNKDFCGAQDRIYFSVGGSLVAVLYVMKISSCLSD